MSSVRRPGYQLRKRAKSKSLYTSSLRAAGKYLLLNGGDRLEGAKKAKIKTIPAIVHPAIIEESERRYIMHALNHARKTHAHSHYVDILRSEFGDDVIIEERRGGDMSQTPVGVSFWRIVRDQVLGGKSERTAQIVIQAAKRQILAERNAKRKPRYGSYELDEGFLNYARRVVRESQSHEAEKIGLEKKV